tara:strand:+ start:315 stop:800 length:486 start_codon:yes stop_codon:yes gene_type:complete
MNGTEIFIFDFDGTIIDSDHRQLSNADGSINLDHWRENCTKEKIFQDQLMPLYEYARRLSIAGFDCYGCTARVLSKHDWEFFFMANLDKIFRKIISRPVGCTTKDSELKSKQLQHFFNFAQFKDREKVFIDDNEDNRIALARMGATVYNPQNSDWVNSLTI